MVAAPVGAGLLCKNCNTLSTRKAAKTAQHFNARHTTRGRSARQEKRTARTYGGRQTANSGALYDKGDVKVDGILRVEDKTTSFASFTLKHADLRKVARAAVGDEIPVLKISFHDDLRQQYVVVPEAWFQRLLGALTNEE